ncbi:MAG: hypothetical protein Ct9H300mP3_10080 [Gammaproteobacteria bacterium]|nr:MAG: hypothetical protein Ct9H300mP3_10080 [Gammaproteobacteria bacterium]
MRGGWIVSHKNFIQENTSLKEGVLDSFLSSYYTAESACPSTILVSENLIDKHTIQVALSEYHNKKISIINKVRNKDIGLMKIRGQILTYTYGDLKGVKKIYLEC